MRVTLASVKDDEAVLRADVEKSSADVAERVARELVEKANETAAEERHVVAAAAEEDLQATLASAHSAAEEVARQALDAARKRCRRASRGVLESRARNCRRPCGPLPKSASKPAAEAAARAVAEEVMRDALKAAHEDESWRRVSAWKKMRLPSRNASGASS